jgi:DNA (cytosine-5)-methyltransferase 1
VAGRRAGLTGERSGLWFEFRRILAESKPRWVVIENVPGLLSSNIGRDFAVVLRGLEELGYCVAARILDAQFFGVAQRRRRVFIVGSLGDYGCLEILFESESLCGDTQKSREAGESTAFTLRANPSHSGDKGDGGINTTLIPFAQNQREELRELGQASSLSAIRRGDGKNETLLAFQGKASANQSMNPSAICPTLDVCKAGGTVVAGTVTGAEAHNGNSNPIAENLIVNCLTGAPYADRAGEEPNLIVAATLNSGGNAGGFRTEPGEHLVPTYWDGGQLSDTLDVCAISKGQMMPDKRRFPCVNAQGVRRLTPTECERLQGFPDGWTAMHKDTVRYRQLGNAVAVPVAGWIGRRLRG